MLNLYPIFNILSCFNIFLMKLKLLLSSYYLLTSFLHIGYLEKCVTARIYPRSSFVPLPAFTDVWNRALRPRHSDWVPKIGQINFTNVTVYSNFEPSHLLYLQSLDRGLGLSCRVFTGFPFLIAATETFPHPQAPVLLLLLRLLTQNGWGRKEPLETA